MKKCDFQACTELESTRLFKVVERIGLIKITKEVINMNKYICLICEMYNNNILLHNPLQIDDSSMPTELIEILRVSNGIEEVITVKDKKESIGWILYSYEMIKNNTGYYAEKYGIKGYVFSDDGAGNVFIIKKDCVYLFNVIDNEEDLFAESLVKFWDIHADVTHDELSNWERADDIVRQYGFDFEKISKDEIRDLIEKEIENFQDGSSEYIRVLCGYLFCIGDVEDVDLLERVKYGINFDVGCMIDGDWIEALKGNMSEEDRQFQIQSFIKYYEIL